MLACGASRTMIFACLFGLTWAAYSPAAEPAPRRPQEQVTPMLKITWTRGPNLPQGLQDGNVGIIDNTLVMACGFCSGRKEPHKPDRYPRGFLSKVWGLNLADRRTGWQRLPDYPGTPRQGLGAITVGNAIYYWGGFNYTAPFCYKEGYHLSRRDGQWTWRRSPEFPWPVSAVGLCAIGSKIYAFGGADYDENRFYTESDRAGKNQRQGSRLLAIDTKDLRAGWKRLPDCPGTPRWVHASSAVGGKVYIIGGATGDLSRDGKNYGYCTVVDNWVYDPPLAKWSRLRDLPIGSGNFPAGDVTFQDRYILLIGGYQYGHVANPDGTIRPTYGKAGRFQGKGEYHNDVFVYDTRTDLFGRADSLPINNNAPMAVVRGNEIFLLGGETGGGWVEGEYYGHHPDLLLTGKIEEVG
jgi:N-acetylneuraminic acid mutarotase